MAKETNMSEIEKLEKELATKKAELKEAKAKYTFKGFYSKVCGRDNILTHLKDATGNDKEKISEAVRIMSEFVAEYE